MKHISFISWNQSILINKQWKYWFHKIVIKKFWVWENHLSLKNVQNWIWKSIIYFFHLWLQRLWKSKSIFLLFAFQFLVPNFGFTFYFSMSRRKVKSKPKSQIYFWIYFFTLLLFAYVLRFWTHYYFPLCLSWFTYNISEYFEGKFFDFSYV